MWSTMKSLLSSQRKPQSEQGACRQRLEARLDDLAPSAGELAELPGRDSRCAAEGADEVGEVGEAHVEGHLGHRLGATGQEASGMPQAGTNQVLVRRHSQHAGE